jgi:hypothetical protein
MRQEATEPESEAFRFAFVSNIKSFLGPTLQKESTAGIVARDTRCLCNCDKNGGAGFGGGVNYRPAPRVS